MKGLGHPLQRKAFIAGVIVCLGVLLVWLSARSPVEVYGDFSRRDVADLIRLGKAERKRDLIDWSAPPPRWSLRQVAYRWRRFRYDSAGPIRIDQMPEHKAEVTIGAKTLMRRYQFANTELGWKPVIPKFE